MPFKRLKKFFPLMIAHKNVCIWNELPSTSQLRQTLAPTYLALQDPSELSSACRRWDSLGWDKDTDNSTSDRWTCKLEVLTGLHVTFYNGRYKIYFRRFQRRGGGEAGGGMREGGGLMISHCKNQNTKISCDHLIVCLGIISWSREAGGGGEGGEGSINPAPKIYYCILP